MCQTHSSTTQSDELLDAACRSVQFWSLDARKLFDAFLDEDSLADSLEDFSKLGSIRLICI